MSTFPRVFPVLGTVGPGHSGHSVGRDDRGRCPMGPGPTVIAGAAAVIAAAGWIVCARQLRGRTAALQRDGLTGLWRREGFEQRARAALATGNAIALLDLDGFKQINDTVGHAAGDEVLRTVADRLAAELGKSALIARLGGDEFAALTTLEVCGVRERLQQLSAALSAPVAVSGAGERAVGVSLGVAWLRDLPVFAGTFDTGPGPWPGLRRWWAARPHAWWSTLLAEGLGAADVAMYAAKAAGQGWRLFDPDVDPVRPAGAIGGVAPRRYREHGPGVLDPSPARRARGVVGRGPAGDRWVEPATLSRRVRRSVTARSTARAERRR